MAYSLSIRLIITLDLSLLHLTMPAADPVGYLYESVALKLDLEHRAIGY